MFYIIQIQNKSFLFFALYTTFLVFTQLCHPTISDELMIKAINAVDRGHKKRCRLKSKTDRQ